MRKTFVALVAGLIMTAVACTPPSTPPADPGPPKINSFTAPGGPFIDPALVPLAWKVSDPNGDDVTCTLMFDDGVVHEVIPNCDTQSRVKSAPVGAHTARLTVTDGISGSATSTAIYIVDPATTSEPFDIVVRPLSPLAPAVAAAFASGAARWESAITTGVSDVSIVIAPTECVESEPGITTVVDDLLVTVEVVPIDGVGGILGQAGPCILSTSDSLTRVGIMQFDSADVATMLSEDTFESVVLHEMGHILGIGTLWDYDRTYLTGLGGSNPRFTGPRGVAEWSTLGGTSTLPVENSGGPGTAGAHWRESTFANELMTGWISAGSNPLSAMSISSLGDLGYHVDRSPADPYSLPSAGVQGRPGVKVDLSGIGRPPITVQ